MGYWGAPWSDSFNKIVGVFTQEVTHLNGSSHTFLTVEVHPTPTTTEIKTELVYITPQHEKPHHFSHTSCCLNDAIKGDGRGNHIEGTNGPPKAVNNEQWVSHPRMLRRAQHTLNKETYLYFSEVRSDRRSKVSSRTCQTED